MTIKSRLDKLEQKHMGGGGLIKSFGIGYLYGDETDFELLTPRAFKRQADEGLAGFYERLEKKDSAKTQTGANEK